MAMTTIVFRSVLMLFMEPFIPMMGFDQQQNDAISCNGTKTQMPIELKHVSRMMFETTASADSAHF